MYYDYRQQKDKIYHFWLYRDKIKMYCVYQMNTTIMTYYYEAWQSHLRDNNKEISTNYWNSPLQSHPCPILWY